MKRWLMRTDSSTRIGAGHVMRCLTLARQARKRGIATEFICRDLPGNMSEVVRAQGFKLHLLPAHDSMSTSHWREDARETRNALAAAHVDWLVVDHYALDANWETELRSHAARVLAIDDLADRLHDCDVLLDQNYHVRGAHRYDLLVPPGCVKLLGLGYVLLREEFHAARLALQRRITDVRRILVNFGGTDETNLTGLAVAALQALRLGGVATDVVIGGTNPHRMSLEQQIARDAQFTLHVQATNMAELIAAADLALGACGSSTWERCYLGLPSMAVAVADNQRNTAQQLADLGIIMHMGGADILTRESLAQGIGQLAQDVAARARLSANSLALMPTTIPDLADKLLEIGG